MHSVIEYSNAALMRIQTSNAI